MDNSTQDLDEKLVLYLDGSLEGEAKAGIEELVKKDPSVSARLESLQQTRAAVRYFGIQQQVKSLHAEMMGELRKDARRTSPVRKMLRYSMAAAASLLLLLGAYMGYQFFRLSPDRVFSARYQRYEPVTMRGVADSGFLALQKEYSEFRYKEVLARVDSMRNAAQAEHFLAAMSAMELRDDTRAISLLKELISTNQSAPEPVLNDEAEYYLALAYIRNKDYDFALTILEKIKADQAHTYHPLVDKALIRKVRLLKWR